jgi:hypothetical protein
MPQWLPTPAPDEPPARETAAGRGLSERAGGCRDLSAVVLAADCPGPLAAAAPMPTCHHGAEGTHKREPAAQCDDEHIRGDSKAKPSIPSADEPGRRTASQPRSSSGGTGTAGMST